MTSVYFDALSNRSRQCETALRRVTFSPLFLPQATRAANALMSLHRAALPLSHFLRCLLNFCSTHDIDGHYIKTAEWRDAQRHH